MTEHDQIFKILLHLFFFEFMELFFEPLYAKIDKSFQQDIDKELFAEKEPSRGSTSDLAIKVRMKNNKNKHLIILIEIQAQTDKKFLERVIYYYTGLRKKYDLEVLPIALFIDNRRSIAPDICVLKTMGRRNLTFEFETIQLNKLNWQDYRDCDNPIIPALMAKMKFAKRERPRVKCECIRMIVNLNIAIQKKQTLYRVVDTYLKLDKSEKTLYEYWVSRLSEAEKRKMMDFISPMERQAMAKGHRQGHKEGHKEGLKEGASLMALQFLNKSIGPLTKTLESRIQNLDSEQLKSLGNSLMDFKTIEDLENWLNS